MIRAAAAELVREPFPVRPFVGPARVLAGEGAGAQLGEELLATGARPADGAALLIGDVAVEQRDLAREAIGSLDEAGFELIPAPGIAAEPTPEVIQDIIGAVDRPVAAVIGLGGGSAMDAAKLVSLCLGNGPAVLDGIAPGASLQAGPPLVLGPSTAGTGAEATAVAMLWRGTRKQIFVHPTFVPRLAVLDSRLLAELPQAVTASAGLDALSHALESLLSTFRTPLTTGAAVAAVEGLARWLPEAYDSGSSDSRMGTLIAAYQAGLALNASVALGHSIAYTIAARTALPHGVTCAMSLPYCLAYCRAAGDRLEPVRAALALEGDPRELVDWVHRLNERMGIPPSLGEVGITADELPAMHHECVEVYPRPNNPVPVEADGIERLLAHFHAGDLDAAWADRFAEEPVR
jgi:alcohol dehydrogenase class IV